MPKTVANAVRKGMVVEHLGKLWRVVSTMHTMPGKGGAFQQMELRDVRVGTKLNERFRAADSIEVVRLDQTHYQYLYMDGDNLVLMHPESYEQIMISIDELGDERAFLQDGMMVDVESFETQVIGVKLPDHVVATIAETEAVIKGQTAASSNKPAILENGVRIMVPTFIDAGEKVVVKVYEQTYVERAK